MREKKRGQTGHGGDNSGSDEYPVDGRREHRSSHVPRTHHQFRSRQAVKQLAKPPATSPYFRQLSLCCCEPILESRRRIMGYDHDDPSLRTGAGGLTVWTLHEMAQKKQFDELNTLFNNGLTMNSLPVGLAAGAAARVFDIDNKIVADALDALTGRNWRGKVFFPSNNKKASKGRNRIKASLLLPNAPIVPMAKFDTMLLDSHPLVREAKSNVVILNYAHPQTRPYWQELALTKVQVYDVQVAVKGKYGPVFIGKTWGKYDRQGQ